jgi:hypothetical protein
MARTSTNPTSRTWPTLNTMPFTVLVPPLIRFEYPASC